jgi:hypothetical protein
VGVHQTHRDTSVTSKSSVDSVMCQHLAVDAIIGGGGNGRDTGSSNRSSSKSMVQTRYFYLEMARTT